MYLGRICNTVHTNLDTAVSEIEKKIEIFKVCINQHKYVELRCIWTPNLLSYTFVHVYCIEYQIHVHVPKFTCKCTRLSQTQSLCIS